MMEEVFTLWTKGNSSYINKFESYVFFIKVLTIRVETSFVCIDTVDLRL